MEDSEPAEDGVLAGLRWNRSARDQAQLKHKIRDLPGLLKHGLHLRKKSVSNSNAPSVCLSVRETDGGTRPSAFPPLMDTTGRSMHVSSLRRVCVSACGSPFFGVP